MTTTSANVDRMNTYLADKNCIDACNYVMNFLNGSINANENSISHNIDEPNHHIQSMVQISKSKINIELANNIADIENSEQNNNEFTQKPAPIACKTKDEVCHYTKDMNNPFVVHTEWPYRHFLIFRDDDEFIEYMNAQPEAERCFHEVIIGNPRTVCVDIDAYLDPAEWAKFGSECVTKFVKYFNEYYENLAYITYDDIVVIDSSGFSENTQMHKFSCQIRTRMYTTTWRENHEFAHLYSATLSRSGVVDEGIYSDYHCMRIPGSTKRGDSRNSRIIGGAALKDSWIGYGRGTWGIKLPEMLEPEVPRNEPQVKIEIMDATINKILKIAEPYSRGYEYKSINGALVLFKRTGIPHQCPVCNNGRIHSSDNGAFYLVIRGNDIYQHCMRNKSHGIHIGTLDAGDVVLTPITPKKISAEQKCKYLIDHPRPKSIHKYQGYDYIEYTEPSMRPYPKVDTLVVHAAKGIGKTEELVRHITTHFGNCRIVALSHRETFAAELARQLPGFALYNKIERGHISLCSNPRVIVQMESLCRLDMMEAASTDMPIDLLIIDESESIIAQLSSPLYKKFNESWAAFDHLVRYAEHVIALDAHVSGRTIDLLRVRENSKRVYIRNEYVRNELKYYITPDSNKWYTQLWIDLAAGKKIVIPTNSASEARAIEHNIKEKYPTKSMRVYTGETDRKDKFDDIRDIADKWRVDVLIYSPTITSGVSFKEKHFDRVYGYFRNGSAGAMECDQMLGRVRDLADLTGYIYIDPRTSECLISRTQLRSQVLHARANLFAQYDMTNLQFTYSKAGRKIHNEDYFELWLDNAIVMNKSRARFMTEMINIFHANGITMEPLIIEADITCIEDVKAAKAQITQAGHDIIAAAEVITDNRADEIRNKIDTTAVERAQLHKYRLMKLYEVPADHITAEWCKLYDTIDSVRWYKSLRAITTQTLTEIQQAEATNIEKHEEDANTWNMKVHFDRHRIAHELLRICGFNDIKDKAIIGRDNILASIRINAAKLDGGFAHMQSTFKIRAKKPDYNTATVKVILGIFNSVLHSQYGIKIAVENTSRAGRNNYRLLHHHDFDPNTFRPLVIVQKNNPQEDQVQPAEWTAADEEYLLAAISS